MEHHKKYNDVTSEGGAMRYVTAWAGSSKCWGSKSSVGNICQAKLLRFRSSVASIFDGQTCARTSKGLLLAGSIARANSDSEFRLIERQSRVEKMFTQRATTSVINTLLPYNNPIGEKEYMPCKQRENEDQVSRPLASTLKTTDLATGKDNSRASRPTSLGRGTTSSNGFSSRFPGSTQAGGSQASSPESSLDMDTDSFQESENNAAHAQLENDTRNLLTAFFHSYNGLKHPRCSQPKALATMDRVVKSLVIKHEIAYKGDTLSWSLFLWYSYLLCPFHMPEVGMS